MKWYSLAHLAAVRMSCFCAELQALQFLFLNSASGIARAFQLYIFKFPDSRCRPLVSLSDNLRGSPANSGPIDFASEKSFPLNFVH